MTNELEKERPFGTDKSLPLYSQPPKLSVLAILLLLYISLRDTLGSLTLASEHSVTIKSCCTCVVTRMDFGTYHATQLSFNPRGLGSNNSVKSCFISENNSSEEFCMYNSILPQCA